MVAHVGDIDIAGTVKSYRWRQKTKLTLATSSTPPFCDESPIGGELLDAVIVHFDNIDVAKGIHCHGRGPVDLAIVATLAPPLGYESTVGTEFPDPASPIGDVDVAGAVHCRCTGPIKIP